MWVLAHGVGHLSSQRPGVEVPNQLKKRELGDSAYYSEWLKVADAAIEADITYSESRVAI